MYTATAIEDLVRVTFKDSASARERHLFRQSLMNLVRIAQAEHRAEMQVSVTKALHPAQAIQPV